MKLFGKKWFALLLAALLVLGSTLLNVNAKLGRKTEALAGEFDSTLAPSLLSLCDKAENLADVAEANDVNADRLRAAAVALRGELGVEADVSGAYERYVQLKGAFDAVNAELAELTLGQRDSAAYAAAVSEATALNAAIATAPYNSSVKSFAAKHGAFPRFMASLAGVFWPEAFA